jgi:SpoVK/Ycf46/Vps4 family AAA+-type ATPase
MKNNPLAQEIVEPELADKITYWILKIILELGGHKEFIDSDNDFTHETMAKFLGLEKYIAYDYDDFHRSEPLNILKKKYEKLSKNRPFKASKLLEKNLNRISKLIILNEYERKILEFVILLKHYDILDNAINLLGENINTSRTKRLLSALLDIPLEYINVVFSSQATFNHSGLLQLDRDNAYSFSSKFQLLNYEFSDNMLNHDNEIMDMVKHSIRLSSEGTLEMEDYSYIKNDLEILLPYLNRALEEKQKGVNILLYGLPGTGKTELSKTIAKILGIKLYEVSYSDSDGDPIDGTARLRVYKTAQALLSKHKTILMYDEAEDVFESYEGGFFMPPKRQSDKAWINKILENNTLPTIWVTNKIESIDNAIIRRFDMSIEMPIPARSKRAEIIKKYSENILSEKEIDKLAQNETIAPALISTAVKVAKLVPTCKKEKVLMKLINNTLKAQGYDEVNKEGTDNLPENYSLEYINTDSNLEELVEGIKEHNSARLCLYGASGTGKSAFAKHIAKVLDKPFIIKSGSSLMSKWVGDTEKNIARAFQEAKEENAVLIFDEVDGFLAERGQAKVNWEVTQVNEMLVQMEKFNGIFIATTNLMDHLDRASLRRFDLKLEFKFLKAPQLEKIFTTYCKELELNEPSSEELADIKALRQITPGDFATIARQSRFRRIKSATEFIERLKEEMSIKKLESGNVMGFVNP